MKISIIRHTASLALGFALIIMGTAQAHDPTFTPAIELTGGIAGPEGIAIDKKRGLFVGSTEGDIINIDADGNQSVFANVGDSLAGIIVLRNGDILACALQADRVWRITPDGTVSVFVSGIGGPNHVAQTKRKETVFVSASLAGSIFDITSGTPVEVATGFSFPNGLAVTKERGSRYLYVAESIAGRVSRMTLSKSDQLGPAEEFATGLPIADGLAFAKQKNLIVVGGGNLDVFEDGVRKLTLTPTEEPLFDFPTNVVFGKARGFLKKDLYAVNFGPALGNGTNVIRMRFNHGGRSVYR